MKSSAAQIRNVWMVSREYGALAGAGGVKDVVEQLSRALAKWNGRRVSVVLPFYGLIDESTLDAEQLRDPDNPSAILQFRVDMNYAGEERGEHVRVWLLKKERVNVYLLDSLRFRDKKDVYTYSAEEEEEDPVKRRGEGHYDYFAMNLLQQKAALQLMMILGERPDVIHCHDGHTSVIPCIIAETSWLRGYFRRTGCLVTIHNAGKGYHQEVDDLPYAQAMTGLPWSAILEGGLDDSFDPLITAGRYAVVNTVSENYARELQETDEDWRTDWLGHRLLTMGRTIEGVTNGVDPEVFDPRKGEELGLSASFDPRIDEEMHGKQLCREGLLAELRNGCTRRGIVQYGHLELGPDTPLFTFVGRLNEQKGVDVLAEAAGMMLAEGREAALLVLGSGTSGMEDMMVGLSRLSEGKGRICFLKGYDPVLANRVYAGGDFFLVPSLYEPCGLTDFIAQLFGNLPVVHGVGGLVKVEDGVSGFTYYGNSGVNLSAAMARAAQCYGDKELVRRMQRQAIERIETKYTWKVVMKKYLELYKKSRLLKRD